MPTNFRKAGTVLYGQPGTGKTLLAKIITNGLRCGYANQTANQFALENCDDCDVIVWEEFYINPFYADWIKKIAEGGPLSIEKKGRKRKVVLDWTPLVGTANHIPWRDVSGTDQIALEERFDCIEVKTDFLQGISKDDLYFIDKLYL